MIMTEQASGPLVGRMVVVSAAFNLNESGKSSSASTMRSKQRPHGHRGYYHEQVRIEINQCTMRHHCITDEDSTETDKEDKHRQRVFFFF